MKVLWELSMHWDYLIRGKKYVFPSQSLLRSVHEVNSQIITASSRPLCKNLTGDPASISKC